MEQFREETSTSLISVNCVLSSCELLVLIYRPDMYMVTASRQADTTGIFDPLKAGLL